LEQRLSAVPLMTAADAARHARVNAETILARGPGRRAPRCRLHWPLPPHLTRCPQPLARYEIIRGGTASSAAPPAPRAKGKRCPSRRHGKRWAEGPRQLGHSPGLTLDTYARDGRARPRTEARGGRRDHAGAQRPASRASGLDRIVGTMSAIGRYDTLPANRDRGATMGPPACTRQSPPVPFRRLRRGGLQGLSASWGDWRGQKAFLIRKRSQVRVLDRSSAGIQEFAAFCAILWDVAVGGSGRSGVPWGHHGATSSYRRAGKRSWFQVVLGSVRTPRRHPGRCPARGREGDHELRLLRAHQRSGASGRPAGCWMTPISVTPPR
jgi:hypothetical protein